MPPPFRQAENAREKPRENTMPGKTHPAGALRRPFLTFRTPAFKLNADFSFPFPGINAPLRRKHKAGTPCDLCTFFSPWPC